MNLYRLPLDIEPLEEGGYLGRSSLLPGLNVQGDSIEEVERLAPGIAKALIEAMQIKGVPLPVQGEEVTSPFHVELLVPARPTGNSHAGYGISGASLSVRRLPLPSAGN